MEKFCSKDWLSAERKVEKFSLPTRGKNPKVEGKRR
jgi:hypothetical protein